MFLATIVAALLIPSAPPSVRVVDQIDEGIVTFDDGSTVRLRELPPCARHEGAHLFEGKCAPVMEEAARVRIRLAREALEVLDPGNDEGEEHVETTPALRGDFAL